MIVCTSFLPFAGRNQNTSLEVVSKLPNMIDGSMIKKEYLDVSWDNIQKEIERILNDNIEKLILCGEANREMVTIEKIAINLMDATIPDNENKYKHNEAITDGKDGYFSNCDIVNICDILNKSGINVKTSLTCGSYICNLSYYWALHIVKKNKLKTKVIFVHFPIKYEDKYIKYLEEIIRIV